MNPEREQNPHIESEDEFPQAVNHRSGDLAVSDLLNLIDLAMPRDEPLSGSPGPDYPRSNEPEEDEEETSSCGSPPPPYSRFPNAQDGDRANEEHDDEDGIISSSDAPPDYREFEGQFSDHDMAYLGAELTKNYYLPPHALSPASRLLGDDPTGTSPAESSNEGTWWGHIQSQSKPEPEPVSPKSDSSHWWSDGDDNDDDGEGSFPGGTLPKPASPSSHILAPTPHHVISHDIWYIEASRIYYSPPDSPAIVQETMVSSPSPPLPYPPEPTGAPPPPPVRGSPAQAINEEDYTSASEFPCSLPTEQNEQIDVLMAAVSEAEPKANVEPKGLGLAASSSSSSTAPARTPAPALASTSARRGRNMSRPHPHLLPPLRAPNDRTYPSNHSCSLTPLPLQNISVFFFLLVLFLLMLPLQLRNCKNLPS